MLNENSQLSQKTCIPCSGQVEPLSPEAAASQLKQIEGWAIDDNSLSISRRFEFKGFAKTMQFINAVAWIAANEAHHPDVSFGYNFVLINYTTHAAKGLTENDFICAAKINELL